MKYLNTLDKHLLTEGGMAPSDERKMKKDRGFIFSGLADAYYPIVNVYPGKRRAEVAYSGPYGLEVTGFSALTPLTNKHEGKDVYQLSESKLTEASKIDKAIGGFPYKMVGKQAVITEPMDDATKERMIKRAEKLGLKAQPNMQGGINIYEGKLNEDILDDAKAALENEYDWTNIEFEGDLSVRFDYDRGQNSMWVNKSGTISGNVPSRNARGVWKVLDKLGLKESKVNESTIGIKTDRSFKPADLTKALDKAKIKYKMNRLSMTLSVLDLDKKYFEDAKQVVDDLGLSVMMAKESKLTEGMSKGAIKKAIKVIDKQIDTETGGDGESLDNETLQALEQERERLESMLEGKVNEAEKGSAEKENREKLKGYAEKINKAGDAADKARDAAKAAEDKKDPEAEAVAKINLQKANAQAVIAKADAKLFKHKLSKDKDKKKNESYVHESFGDFIDEKRRVGSAGYPTVPDPKRSKELGVNVTTIVDKAPKNDPRHFKYKGKLVDYYSIEIEDLDMRDYPDFVDAFISYAEWWKTGKPLKDRELEDMQEDGTFDVNAFIHDNALWT